MKATLRTLYQRARKALRPGYHRARKALRPGPEFPLISLADAFPNAETTRLSAPVTIDVSDFSSYEPDAEIPRVENNQFTAPAAYATILHDVLYCPAHNILLTPDGKRVIRDSVTTQRDPDNLNSELLKKNRAHIEVIEGYSTQLRGRYKAYSHFLIEELPRLAFLNHPYFDSFPAIQLLVPGGFRNLDAPISTPQDPIHFPEGQGPISYEEEYFVSRISPDNLEVKPIRRDRLYRLRNCLFVSFVASEGYWFVPEFALDQITDAFYDAPSQNDRNDRSRRLYISRNKSNHRRITNEDALLARLEPLGFEKHCTEEYTPEEAIDLFQDAEMILQPHGSGVGNLIFAKGATTIILHGTSYSYGPTYFLCKSLDIDYVCLRDVGDLKNPEIPDYSDFEVDINRVMEAVEAHLPSAS
jgi:hypothetical protein